MELLEIRKKYGLSQRATAEILNIPIRTYIRYETNASYGNDLKRKMMENLIINKCEITETKGLLKVSQIKSLLNELFESKYKDSVEFCYLFGSYAKGYATEKSDVDLCVSSNLKGFDFVGLIEDIRKTLNKKVDVIRFSGLENNLALLNEIMKDGIKIYG